MSEMVAFQAASLTDRMKYAQTLSAAGDLIPKGLWSPVVRPDGSMGPAAPSPGKILLVMETGAMLGLNPMAALQGIDVIEGKATISPQLMSALVRQAGHKLEITPSGSITAGDYQVRVVLTRGDDDTVYESVWDPHRAARAGLCKYDRQPDGSWRVIAQSQKGAAKPWQSYPETMCKWRALGDVCREGADDALKGIAYTREEIEHEVSIVADPEPDPTEDWGALIEQAATVEELNVIGARLKEKGEGTETLRAKFAARLGVLEREAAYEDAEVVSDDERVRADNESGDSVSAGEPGGDGAVDQDSERTVGGDA